jgi:hypothetical protein
MDNVKVVVIELPQGNKEYAIIDRGNGEYTSMPKDIYDAEQDAAKPIK